MSTGLLSFLNHLSPFVPFPDSPFSRMLPERVELLQRNMDSLASEELAGHVQNILWEIAHDSDNAERLRRISEHGSNDRQFWEQALRRIDGYLRPDPASRFRPPVFHPSGALAKLGAIDGHWRIGDEFPVQDPRCRALFGSKATRLAIYRKEGLPVPEFVGIDSELAHHLPDDANVRQAFGRSLPRMIAPLEAASEKGFGDPENPLILSVRSGIEGVEATIQGVGLNDQTTAALARRMKDELGAYRRYLKFIVKYGCDVRRIPKAVFDEIGPPVLSLKDLRSQIARAKKIILRDRGIPFPNDPYQQLQETMIAVASVWNQPHIVAYRRREGIPDLPVPAMIVQRQVFGDVGDNSAALTFFSRGVRDGASSGRNGPDGRTRWYGELKMKASGDEVMTGSSRPPSPLHKLFLVMPRLSDPLGDIIKRVEAKHRIPVKGEVIIEEGRPWLLQATEPPMWAFATLRAAIDMYEEGLITLEELKERVSLPVWAALKARKYERPKSSNAFLVTGKSAAVGIGSGEVIFGYRKRPKGSRKGIFILESLPREEREHILKRAAGIVALGDLGSHLYPQAARAGVPVLAQVRESSAVVERVKPGQTVWLDCSRPYDGYLTDVPLEEKDSDLARYIRGEIKLEKIRGDQQKLQAEYVNRYRALMGIPEDYGKFWAYFQENFPRNDPVLAAHFTLMHDRMGIHETLMDFITRIGWAESRWVAEEGSYYSFTPEGALFLETLCERDPRWYAHHLNDTNSGGHSVAVSAFQGLSSRQKAKVMNEMVAEVLSWKAAPGWAGGRFLLIRFISLLAEVQSAVEVLDHLRPVTVRRLIEEFFYFTALQTGMSEQDDQFPALLSYLGDRYEGPNGASVRAEDARYLRDVRSRYRGLEPTIWIGFLASMDPVKLNAGLEDAEMPPKVREWFRSFIL